MEEIPHYIRDEDMIAKISTVKWKGKIFYVVRFLYAKTVKYLPESFLSILPELQLDSW